MEENKLYTIYGAKISKKGDRVNLVLIHGKDEDKEYANVSIKLDNSTSKTKATIKEDFAYIKTPLLKQEAKIEEEELF